MGGGGEIFQEPGWRVSRMKIYHNDFQNNLILIFV